MEDASKVASEHYENFPVGSLLLQSNLRPHVHRIYAFARTADDLADEARDLAGLLAWRRGLEDALTGRGRPPELLSDLASTIREFALPEALFFDLLDAFQQDLTQDRYEDADQLMAYCRKSADPIGRLLLHLHGQTQAENLPLSDRICTALQILNHAQDIKDDYVTRNRIYLPQDLMDRHRVKEADLGADRTSAGLRACLASWGDFVRDSFAQGWPLTRRLEGRFALELKAILQGAALVLDRMQRSGFRVLERRPRIHKSDAPELLLRSLLQPWPPRSIAGPRRRANS